jgi:hypothetical protein
MNGSDFALGVSPECRAKLYDDSLAGQRRVGSATVQLAVVRGARVIGPASPGSHGNRAGGAGDRGHLEQ